MMIMDIVPFNDRHYFYWGNNDNWKPLTSALLVEVSNLSQEPMENCSVICNQ